MDQPHDQPLAPGPQEPRSLFAEETPLPAPAQAAALPAGRTSFNVFTRILLPAGILLGGIAFIAWIAQYLPSAGRQHPPEPSAGPVVDPIRFEGAQGQRGDIGAVFFPDGKEDVRYIPEYELGVSGHYDFPFVNTTNAAAELGIIEINCSCSGVEVCVFEGNQQQEYDKANKAKSNLETITSGLKWHSLEQDKDLKNSIQVPANAAGLLRVAWRGNKSEPEPLRLIVKPWSRPVSGNRYPNPPRLLIAAKYVRPLMFEDTHIDLASFNPKDERTESFFCWSATSNVDVQPASTDKRLQVKVDKLDAKGCEALQQRLRSDNIMTRVHCAYKVTVTLYEQRDGQQLDLGYFARPVPLAITSHGQPIQVPVPILRAHVRGPVFLSPQVEGGRIDFKSFKAKLGAIKKVTLFADVGTKLDYVGCEPSWFAPTVSLTEVKTEEGKTQWELTVDIRPDPEGQGFFLPEDSVLIVDCELPAVGSAPPQKRLVRIPILATVGSH